MSVSQGGQSDSTMVLDSREELADTAGENDSEATLLMLLPLLPGPNKMAGWSEIKKTASK